MSSPTSKRTSWLKEKLSRRTSGTAISNSTIVSNNSSEKDKVLTEVNSLKFEDSRTTRRTIGEGNCSGDIRFLVTREEDCVGLCRTEMESDDVGGQTRTTNRKSSGGGGVVGRMGVLASPVLGGRSSVKSSVKSDKKIMDSADRPMSTGAITHRSTGKKKMLSVAHNSRTPSPGLERNSSQRTSQRHKLKDNYKSSSPSPRDSSPDQGGAFSKVRDTLRIRKVKKKTSSSKVSGYSVPALDLPSSKYADPFEPDFNEPDDKNENGNGHDFTFVNVPHYQPEYCDYCQQAAWGHHQVLKCSKCDFICHKKCESRIFMKCNSKVESEALLQQDRTKESLDESMEFNSEKETKNISDGLISSITQPPSDKAILAKKIREYNRRTTPVHHIHIKHRDALIDYQAFVRVHMCIQRPIHVSTGVTRTSWYRLMRPVKERAIDSGIDGGLETAFYLPTDTNRLVHISNVTTTKDLITTLLKKFCITDNPKKFSLYEEYGSDSRRLFDEDHPLQEVLEASIVGRNSKLALRDNLCSTIQWDAFSLPELNNFITILGREESLYADKLRECFLIWKKNLHDELIDKRGADPHRSTSEPSNLTDSTISMLERSTSDPAKNHPISTATPVKL